MKFVSVKTCVNERGLIIVNGLTRYESSTEVMRSTCTVATLPAVFFLLILYTRVS